MSATNSDPVSPPLKRCQTVASAFPVRWVSRMPHCCSRQWRPTHRRRRAGHSRRWDIPSEGDTTIVGDYEFEVERVKDRIPQSVVARRVVQVPSEDAR